ncbi:MAG: DUF1499 domain-containing protein [Candidatus Electrothrix sp. AW2]|nr:DUF1499 domain-containing protein [Candidatus Electrothrix gigas]
MNSTTRAPILLSALLFLSSCGGNMPDNLGLTDNRLSPCPKSPNCVSSLAGEDKDHAIAPLTYSEPFTEARQRLLDTIRSMKRSTIITADERYIHAELRSRLFRFVDDVEFYFDDQASIIHVRSASRVGHSDLGVNRKRVEEIRNRYTP